MVVGMGDVRGGGWGVVGRGRLVPKNKGGGKSTEAGEDRMASRVSKVPRPRRNGKNVDFVSLKYKKAGNKKEGTRTGTFKVQKRECLDPPIPPLP